MLSRVNFFEKKSQDVSQGFDRAQFKSKEAQVMLEMYEKKWHESESEVSKIHSDGEKDLQDFMKNYKEETAERAPQRQRHGRVTLPL